MSKQWFNASLAPSNHPFHRVCVNYHDSIPAKVHGCVRTDHSSRALPVSGRRRIARVITKQSFQNPYYFFSSFITYNSMSNPVARDFQRSRAATQTVQPTRSKSMDLEAGQPKRRTNTFQTSAPYNTHGRSPRASFDSMRFPHRIARQDTVRNYHSPTRQAWEEPGAEPGVDTGKEAQAHYSKLLAECQITVVDFSDEQLSIEDLDNQGLIDFLAKPQPEWVSCRWINVNGLSWDVIQALGNAYNLHRLAIEDLMNTNGRTKADWYSDHAFSKCLLSSWSSDCGLASALIPFESLLYTYS